ncbi:DUF1254 domain-containing protein [Oryzifoliimicrobium ureilyticus]|uniref:DUF1254 domain-containing protein n=1 Tax=Oryzifoliimicrobium ureilyticus TaxID=3113724 RepID=UPI0030766E70
MFRILSALFAGVVGAFILHLVIILSLPHFTESDAWTKVSREGEAARFHLLSEKIDSAGLSVSDPFVRTAVCSFDVEDAPIRFTAKGGVPFWSIAIFDRASNEVFSMNDRTAVNGALDVVAGTPIELTALRKSLPAAIEQSVLVELTRNQGYAVVRTLVPQASFDDAADRFLRGAGCQPFETGAD